MAAAIERIKNSQQLSRVIKELKLANCKCTNSREKLYLDTETWKLVRRVVSARPRGCEPWYHLLLVSETVR